MALRNPAVEGVSAVVVQALGEKLPCFALRIEVLPSPVGDCFADDLKRFSVRAHDAPVTCFEGIWTIADLVNTVIKEGGVKFAEVAGQPVSIIAGEGNDVQGRNLQLSGSADFNGEVKEIVQWKDSGGLAPLVPDGQARSSSRARGKKKGSAAKREAARWGQHSI